MQVSDRALGQVVSGTAPADYRDQPATESRRDVRLWRAGQNQKDHNDVDSNHSSANVFDIRAGSAPAMEAPVLSDQNATLQQRSLRRKRRRGMEAPQVPRAQARTREDASARGTQQSTNRRERGLSAATSRRVLLGQLSDMGTTVPPMESRRARRILIQIRSYCAHIGRSGHDMLERVSTRFV